jgi:hypothetical protein
MFSDLIQWSESGHGIQSVLPLFLAGFVTTKMEIAVTL